VGRARRTPVGGSSLDGPGYAQDVPILVVVLFVIVAVAAITAARRYMQKIAASWGDAGRELGLDFQQQRFGRPRLSGAIRGMRVEVDIRTQQSGKTQQTFTRYRVWVPSPGFEFKLTRQTGFSRITRFFGAQDLEVGDQSFDDAFVVKTNAPDRLRGMLTTGLRGVLIRTAAAYPGVEFKNDLVHFERQRLETSRDVIVSAVRRFVDVAAALSGGRALDRSARLVTARERGELADIAEKIRNAREQKAETLDEELLELDTLATAGDREAARAKVRDLEKTLPADPDVVGWKRRLESSPSPRTGAAGSPDAEALAEEIFAGNALSFETKESFDQKYRGATVRWTGTVKSVNRIQKGSDLGAEGGDKMIATVASIEHDLYGNTEIDAVVGLARGAGARLDRGNEVTFTGTLVRVDPLVRNIFVADGKVE
jgi:hypothetical protein